MRHRSGTHSCHVCGIQAPTTTFLDRATGYHVAACSTCAPRFTNQQQDPPPPSGRRAVPHVRPERTRELAR